MTQKFLLHKEIHSLEAKIQIQEGELKRNKKHLESLGKKLTQLNIAEAINKQGSAEYKEREGEEDNEYRN